MFPAPFRHQLIPALLLAASLSLLASGAQPLLAAPPVTLSLEVRPEPDWIVVTLSFSEDVEYRLEESRTRLTLHLEAPLDDASLSDRSLESDLLRRIRVGSSSRKAEVVFHLGRNFETFSSAETRDPFRIVLTFRGKGAPLDIPPGGGLTQGEAGTPGGAPGSPAGAGSGAGAEGTVSGVPEGAPVIVLDPGHGGSEDGAVGPGGLKEKDLALDIAQRLRGLLSQSGYAVRLTRQEDTALDLTRRTAAANNAGAALFLSIHANASVRVGARGAETYFLSYDPVADEDAMKVAGAENRQGGEWFPSGGEDDGREIRLVLWEMAQAEHLTLSSRLADLIQIELNALGQTKDRGVKQAPFRVLVGATMPAALVEVGFLSNPEEERKLATGEYRDQVAGALAAAIAKFDRERIVSRGGPTAPFIAGAPR